MSANPDDYALRPSASELVVRTEPEVVCETYLFEPAAEEVSLGRLYAVGETPQRDGVGAELLDMVVQALQREYYREPERGVLASLESALHQANLILHDAAERGFREWMQHFNVAVGVVAGTSLHFSTAGEAAIYLVRRNRVTLVSEDLAQTPITNPLRTFSQVASGTVGLHDTLYWSARPLSPLFRQEDLVRFAAEEVPTVITERLQQLYEDQNADQSLAALAVTITAQLATKKRAALVVDETAPLPARSGVSPRLENRKPIVIHRSMLHFVGLLIGRAITGMWRWLKQVAWPFLVRGSQAGRAGLVRAGGAIAQRRQPVEDAPLAASPASPLGEPQRFGRIGGIRTWPAGLASWFRDLPTTSKIFAGTALVLAVVLVVSLLLLQSKRAEDADIQRASEVLHNARTKVEAAHAALIYDNREQAETLLTEAERGVDELVASGLYQSEATELREQITTATDRLHRVVRASTTQHEIVGDFGELLEGQPTELVAVADQLYTFDPTSNVIGQLDPGTREASVAYDTSQGVGFFTAATAHEADKTVILATDSPGIALFDTRDATLTAQDIALGGAGERIQALAPFGNRLYVYSASQDQIISYSKTLRGYVNPTPWITDSTTPRDTIVDFAIDGSIYTLHSDGMVRELFKGEAADVTFEAADPPLTGADRIIAQENLTDVYVFDPEEKRLVIYTKQGALKQQLYIDVADDVTDAAVAADETVVYFLSGTQVLKVPLTEASN